jgi:hypothetical protein
MTEIEEEIQKIEEERKNITYKYYYCQKCLTRCWMRLVLDFSEGITPVRCPVFRNMKSEWVRL